MTTIQTEILDARSGKLAVLTLNSEKTLNALSLNMLKDCLRTLETWSRRAEISAVWIQGAGEKAFCAGGDIKELAQKGSSLSPADYLQELKNYFSLEYQVDYLLHTYNKPTIAWGHGLVVGGGLGLFRGCDFRIVTHASLLSMPEILIGFFPDVGASWFLNLLPSYLSLFLATTGIRINAQDALDLGLASHKLAATSRQKVVECLLNYNLAEASYCNLSDLLSDSCYKDTHKDSSDISTILPIAPEIRQHIGSFNAEKALTDLQNYTGSNITLQAAATNLKQGSYLSARLSWEHIRRSRQLSLQECLGQDLTLALNCATHSNFFEGVRAMLIDKDHKPKWSFNSPDEITQPVLDAFFAPNVRLQ